MTRKRKEKETGENREILDNYGKYNDDSTVTNLNPSSNINNSTFLSSNITNSLLSSLSNNSTTTLSSSSNNNSTTVSSNNNDLSTSSNAANSISTSSTNKRVVGRKSSSNVWHYAKKSNDGLSATCQLCGYTCALVSHSTSTIRYHLIRKHNKHELIINSSSSSKPQISESLKRELHLLCYNAIILDHRPFNDMRKPGLLAIFNKLCPGYLPPHRNQVSNNLKRLYQHHFQLLKQELNYIDHIGLTIDFWSNRRSFSFLCITGHWFDINNQYTSKIINFSSFNERHTGYNIANAIKENLINLGIYHKIVVVTCDGGPNIVSACNQLDGVIKRIWCCAHRLHLVVINALGFWNKKNEIDNNKSDYPIKEASASNSTSSDVVPFNDEELMDTSWSNDDDETDSIIDQTNADTIENDSLDTNTESDNTNGIIIDDEIMDEIENINLIDDNWSITIDDNVPETDEIQLVMDLLKKCRSIATISKKSTIVAQFIRINKSLLELKNKTINNDCKSRWNSTFILLDALIELQPVIIKLFAEKRTLNLQKKQIENLSKIELSNDDWDFLSLLHRVLKPFFCATEIMSGKNYPSIGLAYHAVYKIKHFCSNHNSPNSHIEELKKLLLAKLHTYFYDDIEQFQYFQQHAFFDPAAHLSFTDAERQHCERYVKRLIMDDNYPQKQVSSDTSKSLSTTNLSASSSTTSSQQHQSEKSNSSKLSTYDKFIEACGEEDLLCETNKEKSKRICLNEELKQFRLAIQEFNSKHKPSTTTVMEFWQTYYLQLPLLFHLAKVHLVACGSSVPSESAFSCSAYVARKERSRLSPDNLCFSVFLKDKLGKN